MIPLVDDQSKLGLLGDRWGSSERLLVMDRLMTGRNGHPLLMQFLRSNLPFWCKAEYFTLTSIIG
jgi:hypothetical protein